MCMLDKQTVHGRLVPTAIASLTPVYPSQVLRGKSATGTPTFLPLTLTGRSICLRAEPPVL